MENQKIILFQEKKVRREWHNDQWHFSVVDVIEVLTDSTAPSKYWNALKRREPQVSTICRKLKMKGADGKNYPTEVANTEGLLRIIMSVPSPKAEPFKLGESILKKLRIQNWVLNVYDRFIKPKVTRMIGLLCVEKASKFGKN